MSKPDTIKIDEVEYVRKDAVKGCEGDIKIVVLDRGFVYVGHVKLDGDFVTITGAKNLRKWGTTKGLGELVSEIEIGDFDEPAFGVGFFCETLELRRGFLVRVELVEEPVRTLEHGELAARDLDGFVRVVRGGH